MSSAKLGDIVALCCSVGASSGTYPGATWAMPTNQGVSGVSMPTGAPGTWCTPTQLAGAMHT